MITSHAVKVAVTSGLNANMTGYLPINSIYQLLKSRSFSKHKVPIKVTIIKEQSIPKGNTTESMHKVPIKITIQNEYTKYP